MKPQQITILVLDVNQQSTEKIAEPLRAKGYRVLTSTSASESLSNSDTRSAHLVLVETDLAGEMKGLGVIKQLKQINRQVCAILMDSEPAVGTAVEAMRLGACDYLVKPVGEERLLESVEGALAKKGMFLTSSETINKVIGARLRDIRRDRNLTTQQLADRVGVTQSQISQIETGRSAASVVTLYNISQALELSLAELLDGI
jgi:DNA-binding NtrC family response regulator